MQALLMLSYGGLPWQGFIHLKGLIKELGLLQWHCGACQVVKPACFQHSNIQLTSDVFLTLQEKGGDVSAAYAEMGQKGGETRKDQMAEVRAHALCRSRHNVDAQSYDQVLQSCACANSDRALQTAKACHRSVFQHC